MSLVDLRIELPAFSHSFQIQVPPSSSILDVKQEIQRTCPGAPRVDGQRVIWRGRFLGDEEKLQNVWSSPDDSRVLHLAVHPSAWTGTPPLAPQSSQSRTTPLMTPSQSPQIVYPPMPTVPPPTPQPRPLSQQPATQLTYRSLVPPPAGTPLTYVVHLHNNAVHVLTTGRLPSNPPEPSQLTTSRMLAVSTLQSQGWFWPPQLDEEYPSYDGASTGVRYERVIIENQPFLQLMTPDTAPNPLQIHALKVLTHTFPLLSIPSPDSASSFATSQTTPFTHTQVTNLNNHLQQVGLPPLRLIPNANANQNPNDPNNPLAAAEIRAIPLRALMVPLMMLTFRTVLLLYFFSPSKRPLFGIVLSAWILYEAWGAIRAVIGNGDQPAAQAREGGNGAGAGQGAGPRIPGPAGGIQPGGNNQGARRSQMDSILDRLSNLNLTSEDATLDTDSRDITPPSLAHRAKTFISLLITTLHPAVWDRRRTVLRRREGRIRTEANLRESQPREEGDETPESVQRAQSRLNMIARHERRPRWVREYVQRVQHSEWVDDA
ncbi:hypothetical protein QCA50_000173 [Cerrena zonata]|uniref:Ubiquitin-like domain-containing protein n=1 Tax=Cerrena zonata TaxID=2478898 RepID=A0AAW0GTX5_9APHY